LIEQLAASHAAQRDLAKRLDERERHYKDRIREQEQQHKNRMREQEQHHQHRVSELQKELSQCQKRETAVREVFLQNFETTNSIAQERLELRELKAWLACKSKQIDREQQDFERDKAKIHSKTHKTTSSTQEEPTANDFGKSGESNKKTPVWRWMPKVGKTYDFNISLPNKRFKEYDLPLSTKQMNDPAVELMRRHDYYVGWLDSFHARPLPTDEQHPRNAYIAGANAGAVLAWIQYCEKDRADWAVCMFNNYSDMKPIATWKVPEAVLVAKSPLGDFWRGFMHGTAIAKLKFEEECDKEV
jgi:hypothetical protein